MKKAKQPYYTPKIPKLGKSKLRVLIESPHVLHVYNCKNISITAQQTARPYVEGVGLIPYLEPKRFVVEFEVE